MDEIDLTEKEVQELTQRQNVINQYNIALGILRRQYLNAEAELSEKIQQVEVDYLNLLKFIFQNKVSDDMSNWRFDPTNFIFKKK